MKKLKRFICSIILFIIIISSGQVFASTDFSSLIGELEYTEEFKKWLELDDEEKSKVMAPRSYNIPATTYEYSNPIKIAHTVGSSTLSKYNLKDYIPENVVVRNQMQTNSCWAFASLGMLESHLGLSDYTNNKTVTAYDFSERHMQYATIREFNNGEINIWGGDRKTSDGGNYYRSRPYLTNGLGPINESDMPFENNENTIDISEIQGKTVTAKLTDTIDFPSLASGGDATELINQMKEHIRKNGGIEAGIHGADLNSIYYNNTTGAIFSNDADKGKQDHDVVIIGWDDDYAIENFNEECRPQNKGAWIIKNSWGTESVTKFSEIKKLIFEKYEDKCKQNGWNTAEEIPDDFVEYIYKDTEYKVRGDELVLKIGDDGFMYVSYEDVNIYKTLTGIEKATTTVDYDKIYQYDELGAVIGLPLTTTRVYASNIFERNASDTEYLSEVSVFLAQATICEVYINPNGNSLATQDLIKVELKEGNSESVTAGYHTLELKEPLKLTSDKFAVVLELEGKTTGSYVLPIEAKVDSSAWATAKVEENKSFWTIDGEFEKNVWVSLSETEKYTNGKIPNGDFSIKAFTISALPKGELESIEIATPPTKTDYIEGQDFDKTGMVVNAVYESGFKEEVTDYTIENGTNLKVDQKTVIIKYGEKVTTQSIKVTAKATEDEKVENPESTDFSKAEATASNIRAYYFTDKNNKEYVTMSVLIDKLTKKENDSYKYYYYLSSSTSEENIKDWVEITENQNASTKIEFAINTKDISNYSEVSKSDKLYIYIKEIVKKNELQKELVTTGIILNQTGEIEIYNDNVKQQTSTDNSNSDSNNSNNNNNSSSNNDSNNNSSNNSNSDSNSSSSSSSSSSSQTTQTTTQTTDTTTSTTKLPAAGLKIGIVFVIIGFAIFGTIKFIQYKRMNF